MNEEEKYKEIRDKLKKLPKIKASENFNIKLKQKINLAESKITGKELHKELTKKREDNLINKILGSTTRPWLIPAMSMIVIIFVILIFVYKTRDVQDIPIITQEKSEQQIISAPTTTSETEKPKEKQEQIAKVEEKEDKKTETKMPAVKTSGTLRSTDEVRQAPTLPPAETDNIKVQTKTKDAKGTMREEGEKVGTDELGKMPETKEEKKSEKSTIKKDTSKVKMKLILTEEEIKSIRDSVEKK